jgi:hypothetical protein
MLVPMAGRLTFAAGVVGKLQQIIDPVKPGQVGLLPRGKVK